jgi:cytochrome c
MKRIAIGMALLVAATGIANAAGDAEAGKMVFMKCMICHKVGPGAMNGVGPHLNGVVGRKAGTVEGYAYSDANKNSGLTWDEATLTKYLPGPQQLVPGTKMTFVGLPDPKDVADVIAYLKTFKADGTTQ